MYLRLLVIKTINNKSRNFMGDLSFHSHAFPPSLRFLSTSLTFTWSMFDLLWLSKRGKEYRAIDGKDEGENSERRKCRRVKCRRGGFEKQIIMEIKMTAMVTILIMLNIMIIIIIEM